ncbi:hypothetical protein [Neptuniibacter sp. QD37_11]|uniref:hypothetical protein n=1 Tax=Neptuniibacter sp. QD37_11 TaxID=3398209 RepID=UPI0039F4DFB2
MTSENLSPLAKAKLTREAWSLKEIEIQRAFILATSLIQIAEPINPPILLKVLEHIDCNKEYALKQVEAMVKKEWISIALKNGVDKLTTAESNLPDIHVIVTRKGAKAILNMNKSWK